ncbi:MAG: TolC family protein [Myxococcota bacterium]
MGLLTVIFLASLSAPSPAAPLDLSTALQLAQKVDERPAIARSQAAEARAQHRLAWSRLLPTLSLSGTYRRRAFEVVRAFEGQTATFQAFNALATEGRVDTRLFDASAIPDIQATDLTAEAREAQAEDQARQIAFQTAEAFYAALAADRTLAAAQQRLTLATATSSDARARFDAGLVARTEVDRTRLDEAEARQSEAEAARARRLARVALGFLVGFEPTGRLMVPAPPASTLENRKYRRPDIEAARLLATAARRAAWGPWLSMIPALDLAASLRANNETGFQDQVFNWDIALTLTWVLYDGGQRYAQADARKAQTDAARLTLAALERTAEVERARAAADLSASMTVLEQAGMRARLAEELRTAVRERFNRGLASALEVTDAATRAFEANVALEQARFQTAQAALALRNAVGAWPTADAS